MENLQQQMVDKEMQLHGCECSARELQQQLSSARTDCTLVQESLLDAQTTITRLQEKLNLESAKVCF